MLHPLSPREAEICHAASTGLTNKEIADQLRIRQCTVDSYWRRIFAKLEARGRTHAVSLWLGTESERARERESGEREAGGVAPSGSLSRSPAFPLSAPSP